MSKCSACPASAYCLVYGPEYMKEHLKICPNCGRVFVYRYRGATGTFGEKYFPAGTLCTEISEQLDTIGFKGGYKAIKCAQCYLKK